MRIFFLQKSNFTDLYNTISAIWYGENLTLQYLEFVDWSTNKRSCTDVRVSIGSCSFLKSIVIDLANKS